MDGANSTGLEGPQGDDARGPAKAGSPDLHQAKMRFAVLVGCVLYASYIGLFEGGFSDVDATIAWLDATLFGLFALHTYRHFKRHPAPEYWRRSIGLVADHGAALAVLAISGKDAGALAWLPLFIVQGVGFRFGVRWLFASQAIGLVSVAVVYQVNPFFREESTVALGTLLSVLVLPIYFAILAKREASIKAELVAARQEAEAANVAKSRFVAMVSHELRTPLTGISGLNEVLRDQPLPAATKEMLADQHAATQLMLTMVNDILDLSKIEDGQMQPIPVDFDLHELARHVFHGLSFQAGRKGIESRLELDPLLPRRINGSAFHLTRILQNLLGNAIKFTAKGSVTLRVECAAPSTHDGVPVRFRIEDTGIGIPAESVHRVFDRFYQVDAAVTRRFGGTGLGTTIVKEFCDLLGGRIEVESEVGKGSCFTVTLPFKAASTAADEAEAPDSMPMRLDAGSEGAPLARILVAEDTPTIQIFMRATLEAAGFEACLVGDGEAALSALLERPFDAVVMDWNMPERDGISVLAAVRGTTGPNARTPVVLATAAPSQDLVDEAMRSGAHSVLGKPFAGKQLVSAVSRALGSTNRDRACQAADLPTTALHGSDPHALPVFDRAVFETPGSPLSRLDPHLLLTTFSKDVERHKTQFARAVTTGNYELFQSAVHSITGYASTFGARRLAHLLSTAPRDAADFAARGRASSEAICRAIDLTSAALHEWAASRLPAAA